MSRNAEHVAATTEEAFRLAAVIPVNRCLGNPCARGSAQSSARFLCLAAPPPAPRLKPRPEFPQLAVLTGEGHQGLMRALAEVGGVFEEALLAAAQAEDRAFDRGIGCRFEGRSQLAFDRKEFLSSTSSEPKVCSSGERGRASGAASLTISDSFESTYRVTHFVTLGNKN